MTTIRSRAATAAAVVVVVGVLALPRFTPAGDGGAIHAQNGTATADVVIDFDDGRVAVHRIAFDEGPTGEALLRSAGVGAELNGGAVCRIGGVGCPLSNCFCGPYWAYHWRADDGGWTYASTGPAGRTLKAGDVDAWVWRGARAPITATAQQRAVWLGARWLGAQQLPGGDYPSPGLAVEAILAARAAGVDPDDWTRDGYRVVDYLVDEWADYSEPSAAQAGKALVGLVASVDGIYARVLGDATARLDGFYDPATGGYGLSTWEQAWAILGTVAATNGAPPPRAAIDALVAGAAPGGGWSSMLGEPEAETDATGLAVQALVAAGEPVTSTAIAQAIAYLDAGQRDDGGWGHDGHHETTNANSTAYALQALYAAGEDPTSPRWTSPAGRSAIDHLMALQRPDGAVAFDATGGGHALVATGQAIPALAGRPLAVPRPGVAADRAFAWLRDARTADGAFAAGAANPGATIDAVVALTAHDRGGWRDRPGEAPGVTAAAYLATIAPDYAARGPSAAGKLLAAIGALRAASGDAAALDPRAFGGVDVVGALQARYDPATGAFGDGAPWDQAWAILGSSAVGIEVPAAAVDALRAVASPAGGWGWEARAAAPDVDSTGLALQALGAVGRTADDDAVAAAVAFLRRTQNATGGWSGFGPPDGLSVDTTAAAVLGLAAVGQRVDRTAWYRPSSARPLGLGPLDALAAAASPSGAFPGFGGPDDVVATAAALRALAEPGSGVPARPTVHLPLALVPRR